MKRKILLVLFTLVFIITLIPPKQADAAGTIPKGAKEFKGNYYYVYKDEMSWEAAKETCESLGGHLVVITSASEQDFIEKMAKERNCTYWLGGYRNSDDWKWVTGETWKFTAWNSGSPYTMYDHNYLRLVDNNLWTNDYQSGYRFGYICEWEAEDVDTRLPEKVVISSVKKAASTSVIITWKAVNDAEGYSIYMKTGAEGKYTKIADIKEGDITTYMKNDLSKGNVYYYRVRAYKTIYSEKSYGELSKSKKITL
jgi:hypothetical protein